MKVIPNSVTNHRLSMLKAPPAVDIFEHKNAQLLQNCCSYWAILSHLKVYE
jgi:hypothetical protein